MHNDSDRHRNIDIKKTGWPMYAFSWRMRQMTCVDQLWFDNMARGVTTTSAVVFSSYLFALINGNVVTHMLVFLRASKWCVFTIFSLSVSAGDDARQRLRPR